MATSLVRYFDAFLVNHRPHHIQDVLSHADLPGRKHAPHMLFLTTYVISARVCVETAGCAAQHEKHNSRRLPNWSCSRNERQLNNLDWPCGSIDLIHRVAYTLSLLDKSRLLLPFCFFFLF
jgi:hypothetical protein